MEVHRGLFPPASPLGRDRLFRRETLEQERQPSTFHGHAVFRLSPELQLVYIAAHWAMGFQPIGGLIALLDATYLLQQTAGALDWGRLLAWLEGSAAAAPLYLLLTYLDASHLVDLPSEVLPQLRTRQHALSPTRLALGHWLVHQYFVAGHPSGRILSNYGWILWLTLLFGPGALAAKLLRAPGRRLAASRLGPGDRLTAAAGHERL